MTGLLSPIGPEVRRLGKTGCAEVRAATGKLCRRKLRAENCNFGITRILA